MWVVERFKHCIILFVCYGREWKRGMFFSHLKKKNKKIKKKKKTKKQKKKKKKKKKHLTQNP